MAIQTQFNNFEKLVADSEMPLLVVFYAPWCGPSHLMNSALEQINARLNPRLQIIKVNSEDYPQLATQYHVHPLPALVLFRQGQPIARIEAEHTEELLPVDRLIERLELLLAKS